MIRFYSTRYYESLKRDSSIKKHILSMVYDSWLLNGLKKHSLELYLKLEKRSRESIASHNDALEESFIGGGSNTIKRKSRFVSNVANLNKTQGLFKLYKYSSCVYMVYVLIRVFLLRRILASIWPGAKLHCYLLGRMILFGPAFEMVTGLICTYHLSWRIFFSFFSPPLRLDFIIFMLQPSRNIERIYNLENRITKDRRNFTVFEQYLHSMLYYPVKYATRIRFRLRTNRTKKARAMLTRLVAIANIVGKVSLVSWASVILPMTVYFSINRIIYAQSYSGCDSEVDEMYRNGSLKAYSTSFGRHQMIVIVFDLTENFILWFDTACSSFLATGLIYLLNSDLLIYWQNLSKRLESSVRQFQRRQTFETVLKGVGTSGDPSAMTAKPIWSGLHIRNLYYNDCTHEIQSEARDFFQQISSVDAYVSKFISQLVVVWFGNYAAANYFSSTYRDLTSLQRSNLRSLYMVIVVIIPVNFYMFILHHKTRQIHGHICSLMAYDSSKYKRSYMKILDYYTSLNRNAYTFFGGHAFTPSTFLTLIGWTFSCSIIIASLYEF